MFLVGCSNSYEFETGELKTFKLLREIFKKNETKFYDSRLLLTRQQIDKAGVPVLFVELASGQNGTLTPYPGNGDGITWLGADGATITFEQGILKASRGMGDDLMGSSSTMPRWSEINSSINYKRNMKYLSGNNQILTKVFNCVIEKTNNEKIITVWQIPFTTKVYQETCQGVDDVIKNTYFVDYSLVVRKSLQFHSSSIGYITTERLDR